MTNFDSHYHDMIWVPILTVTAGVTSKKYRVIKEHISMVFGHIIKRNWSGTYKWWIVFIFGKLWLQFVFVWQYPPGALWHGGFQKKKMEKKNGTKKNSLSSLKW